MDMNKIHKILEDIEKPLNFAAKNDFKNIGKLAGISEYINQMRIKAVSLSVDSKTSNYLNEIENNFLRFENKKLSDKKDIVNKSIKLINKLKGQVSNKPVLKEKKPQHLSKENINRDKNRSTNTNIYNFLMIFSNTLII